MSGKSSPPADVSSGDIDHDQTQGGTDGNPHADSASTNHDNASHSETYLTQNDVSSTWEILETSSGNGSGNVSDGITLPNPTTGEVYRFECRFGSQWKRIVVDGDRDSTYEWQERDGSGGLLSQSNDKIEPNYIGNFVVVDAYPTGFSVEFYWPVSTGVFQASYPNEATNDISVTQTEGDYQMVVKRFTG